MRPARFFLAVCVIAVLQGWSKSAAADRWIGAAFVVVRVTSAWGARTLFALWRKTDLKLDGREWNSYSVKAGWSLCLQRKKRNIDYLGPPAGWFMAAFILGDQAVSAARNSILPPSVIAIISEARRYAEGTAVRVEEAEDVDVVKTRAKIKVEN